MNGKQILFTALTLGACGLVKADDLLDAKLNALKEKVHRRTYSESAIVDEQNLTVPQTVSAQEKALDKKILAMEKKGGAEAGIITRQLPPTRSVQRTEKAASANWLTPALLQDISGDEDAESTDDDSWLFKELNRQKELEQQQLTEEEQQQLIEQRLNGSASQNPASARDPLNPYDDSLQRIISGGSAKSASTPSYVQEPRSIYNRLEEPSGTTQEAEPKKESVFSIPTYREPTRNRPFSMERASESTTTPDRSRSTAPSSEQPSSWKQPEEPIRKRILQTSPYYEEDPFEKNMIPDRQQSIWE